MAEGKGGGIGQALGYALIPQTMMGIDAAQKRDEQDSVLKRLMGTIGQEPQAAGAMPGAAGAPAMAAWMPTANVAQGQYDTKLSPPDEMAFQSWKARYAPKDSGADYDLRGAFKAGFKPDPQTGHWPDTFKKPNHPTFSDQSNYARDAPGLAGSWDSDGPNAKYIPPRGLDAMPALPSIAARPMPTRAALPSTDFNAMVGGRYNEADLPGAQKGFDLDQFKMLATAFPKELASARLSQIMAGPTAHEIPEGGSLVYTDRNGNPIRTIRGTPKPVKTDLVTLKFPNGSTKSFDATNDGQSIQAAIAHGATEVKTPAAIVNMPGLEQSYSQEMGKINAKSYSDLQSSGIDAARQAPNIDRLGDLASQVETGAFKGTTTELKAKAKALGIDLGALGIADDVAPAQALQALSREQALQLRNPAGGAGMPGAMSDQDRNYLESMVAGLDKQTTTNAMITDARRKLNKRNQEIASLANKYTREHSDRFDQAGFQEYLGQWAEKNPLFPKTAPSASPQAPPGPPPIGKNGKPMKWVPG